MGLEAFTGKVSDLVETNPPGTDPKSQGDDHIRGIKKTIIGQSVATQFGQNTNPTHNFSTSTNDDGTMRFGRGNAGAISQDIWSVDEDGVVRMPLTPIANCPMGGNVALQASWARLPIYSAYVVGFTFAGEQVNVPKDGSYLVTATMFTDAISDAQGIRIVKAGGVIKTSVNGATGLGGSMSCGAIVYLAKGDYLAIEGVRGSTPCNAIGGQTSLEAVFLQ